MPSTRMLNGVAVLGLAESGDIDNSFIDNRLKDSPLPRRSSQVGAKTRV